MRVMFRLSQNSREDLGAPPKTAAGPVPPFLLGGVFLPGSAIRLVAGPP